MKKTLVLASLLAAFGAASAQSSVTLSGKLAYGYESTKSATGVKTNGIATTDGDFVISSVESLGNGLTAGASMAILSRGRDNGGSASLEKADGTVVPVTGLITGRDASVFLAGGFGRLTLGAIEAGNGILPIGGAGANTYGLDGTVLSPAANVHLLGYTSPAVFPGLTFSASLTDNPAASGGMESTSPASDSSTFGVNYAMGPIAAVLNTTKWSKNAATAPKSRVRLAASYNFGVARVGFGYQTVDSTAATNNTNTQMVVGVSAPVGPVTLGLNYATNKQEGGSYTAKGLDFGAVYALSPRTNVALHYQSVKAAAVNPTAATKYRVRLMHNF